MTQPVGLAPGGSERIMTTKPVTPRPRLELLVGSLRAAAPADDFISGRLR